MYRDRRAEAALSVLSDRRAGRAADAGSHIGESLYSDSRKSGSHVSGSDIGIVFRTFCFGKVSTR